MKNLGGVRFPAATIQKKFASLRSLDKKKYRLFTCSRA
jgi:hypothetical protein